MIKINTSGIKYFLLAQKYAWKEFFAYRAQGIIWMFVGVYTILFTYVPITIIYNISPGIPGWSYLEILLLSNTMLVVLGFTFYVISPWTIVEGMRTGELDKYLIRPYGKINCMLSGYSGWLGEFSSIIPSIVVIAYILLSIHLSPLLIFLYVIAMGVGIAMFITLFLFLTLISYRTLGSSNFSQIIMNISSMVGTYPISIYGIGIQLIFTILIPIGFAVYYPIESLLGFVNPFFGILSIIASIVLILLFRYAFNRLIKGYSSGGG